MVKNSASAKAAPDRALVIVLAVIVALVLVAVAAILLRGSPEELDPTSPEGVVQRYSVAMIAGDEATAMGMLSDRLSTGCERLSGNVASDTRITLLKTDDRVESASVSVLIRISDGGGPLSSGEYELREAFQLIKESGVWKVDKAPYELSLCDGW